MEVNILSLPHIFQKIKFKAAFSLRIPALYCFISLLGRRSLANVSNVQTVPEFT